MPVKRNPEWPRLDPAALAEARKAKGIPQRTLSRMIGMSDHYIGRIERGHYLPPTERTQQIADILGVTLDDIQEYPGNP